MEFRQVLYRSQAACADEVQNRLDHALSEAANLEALDAQLSDQIRKQQAELARQAAAATRSRSGSGGGGGGSSRVTFNGSLSTVSCPSGGSITDRKSTRLNSSH